MSRNVHVFCREEREGERERERLFLGLWTTQRPRGLGIERRWVILVIFESVVKLFFKIFFILK